MQKKKGSTEGGTSRNTNDGDWPFIDHFSQLKTKLHSVDCNNEKTIHEYTLVSQNGQISLNYY